MALYLLDERPDYGSSVGFTPSVASIQYGDGYQQDTPMGLNNCADVFTVSFKRGLAEAKALRTLLKSFSGAQRFLFQPAWHDSPIKVVTQGEVKLISNNWGEHVVSATFKQVFDPD